MERRVQLPTFKYHPDPVHSKVAQPSKGPCPRCGQDRGICYVGPFYSVHEVSRLCFTCIADGSAAHQWQLEFIDPSGPEPLDDPVRRDELLHRTPGYFSAQGDPWPVHCGDYCALLGPVAWADITHLEHDLQPDIFRLQRELRLSRVELVSELSRPASPLWAHLFQCLSCSQHRLVADYE